MSNLYGEQHKALQQAFDTGPLAERIEQLIVQDEIGDDHKAFIESRDMFFLATVDHRGFPSCSYKGGPAGFVRVLDARTLAFPSYDGNGMYLSAGNVSAHPRVGLLFIDFETPHRLRVHGTAAIDRDDPLRGEMPGAELVLRVRIEEVFVNCPRYIHRQQRIETSKYTPQPDFEAPLTPQWKRIDAIQDVLPARDAEIGQRLGTITAEEYGELVGKGHG